MKISGRNTIAAPPQTVWDAINDPAVLARTLPGCESMEVVGDGAYKATVTAGVASIRGTYTGTVVLSDLQEPESLTLAAQGAGSAGTIGADVDVVLEEEGDATVVVWDAEAIVGGTIGGVGQRMLAGVSQRMAGEFFGNLEDDILNGPPAVDVAPGGEADAGADPRATGTVFAGSAGAARAGGDDTARLVGAFLLGAAVALVGVLVGRRTR
ncbi:MAG TPA: carbon monoxide dehydrogenase subunit G [Nitriliruptoraceae bacterium]|nr:carbon monoxide dehydrogenase subunit G [Nitriliruptoraceae bacterium]